VNNAQLDPAQKPPRNAQLNLYREMLRIRLVEERIAALYTEWEMRCPVHLCIGQEAIAVGACSVLDHRDYALSGHRSHGHYLAKGGDLKAMMAEIYGKATGCAGGKGGSMHLIDLDVGFLGSAPIVGSTIPIAVGAAFGTAMKDERRVTVAFLGEGAVEAGVFYESLNFAALKKLPVIFVCENNLYSVYSPLEVRQPPRSIVGIARAMSVEGYEADGNDVEAVRKLCSQAADKARNGGGPTFLEFSTYRWREHCGPEFDNHIGYRSEEEYLLWKERCPLVRLEGDLLGSKAVSRAELDAVTTEINREIDAAIAFAKQSPFPDKSVASSHVVAE
jgi:pyruvate dehydrogenase E1 component alpha subunit